MGVRAGSALAALVLATLALTAPWTDRSDSPLAQAPATAPVAHAPATAPLAQAPAAADRSTPRQSPDPKTSAPAAPEEQSGLGGLGGLSRPGHTPALTDGAQHGNYDWPLAGQPPVLQEFEPPPAPWAPGHRGVDLGTEAGAQVLAAGAGIVAFTGWVAGRPVVSIDHDDGIRTTYEPVTASVSTGEQVELGEQIGQLQPAGTPHCEAQPCLHWGARIGPQEYLDPLLLIQREPPVIRLYPAWP